jgi:hypothetical protein
MKRATAVGALLLLCAAHPALSQKRPFGLGIIAGEPVGATFKVWFGRFFTLDMAAGADFAPVSRRPFDYDFPATFQVHADVCVHATFIRFGTARMPLYVGVGPKWNFRHGADFRMRTPVGFALLAPEPPFPWELFLEFVPTWGARPTVFDPDFGLGMRYYF